MSHVTFREGSELASGRYRLERRLGAGGMATVWLALDTRLARSVAIKLPSEALASDDTFAIRFEREAQTAAALSHPHLVSVFDYGTEGDRPYLVSEYIDGLNLAQMRDRMRAPETEALARTLLEALAHIHRVGKEASAPETSTTETSTVTDSTTVPVEPPAPVPKEDGTTGGTDPARGAELNNEGFALLQQGDVAGALPKLQEAVSLFPDDSTEIDYAYALFNYAQALRLSGDPAEAIPLLEKRLSFSDFKVDEVEAELAAAKKAAGQ